MQDFMQYYLNTPMKSITRYIISLLPELKRTFIMPTHFTYENMVMTKENHPAEIFFPIFKGFLRYLYEVNLFNFKK